MIPVPGTITDPAMEGVWNRNYITDRDTADETPELLGAITPGHKRLEEGLAAADKLRALADSTLASLENAKKRPFLMTKAGTFTRESVEAVVAERDRYKAALAAIGIAGDEPIRREALAALDALGDGVWLSREEAKTIRSILSDVDGDLGIPVSKAWADRLDARLSEAKDG